MRRQWPQPFPLPPVPSPMRMHHWANMERVSKGLPPLPLTKEIAR